MGPNCDVVVCDFRGIRGACCVRYCGYSPSAGTCMSQAVEINNELKTPDNTMQSRQSPEKKIDNLTEQPPQNANVTKRKTSTGTVASTKTSEATIEKVNAITTDIKNSLFALKVCPNQRKGKMKDFRTEVFDFEIYAKSRKSVGFVTSRPVRWAMAFETYLSTIASSHCRWRYKQDSNRYTFAHLLLFYDNTKKVEISIQFSSGSIVVNGEHFKHFVEIEFPKVRDIFEHLTDCPDEKEPEEVLNDNFKEVNSSIDLLWQKLEGFESAMDVQDKVTQSIIGRCQTTELKLKSHDDSIPSFVTDAMLLIVERKLDEKISVFMETTLEEVEKLLDATSKSLKSSLNTLRTTVRQVQDECLKKEGEQKESQNDNDTVQSQIEIDLSNVDPEKLKSVLDLEQETRQIAKDEIEKSGILTLLDKGTEETSAEEVDDSLSTKVRVIEGRLQEFQEGAVTIASTTYDQKLTGFERQLKTIQDNLASIGPSTHPTTFDIPADARSQLNNSKPHQPPPPPQSSYQPNTADEKLDLLICFDSNWQHVDRRKLWKVNGSELKRCGTLFDVSRVITSSSIKQLLHLLLHVGTNDLDNKDHKQVFGELELLLEAIRLKFPGISIVISELLPRNDHRDAEVKLFNQVLMDYVLNHQDVTIARHHNMRDPGYSMFYDEKHIKDTAVSRFSANLIRALLKSYKIKSKSELFATTGNRTQSAFPLMRNMQAYPSTEQRSYGNSQNNFSKEAVPPAQRQQGDIRSKMMNFAGYDPLTQSKAMNGSDAIVRGVLQKLGDYIQNCIR